MSAAIQRFGHAVSAWFSRKSKEAEDSQAEEVVNQAVENATKKGDNQATAVAQEAAAAKGLRRQEAAKLQEAAAAHADALLEAKKGKDDLAKSALAREEAAKNTAKIYGDQAAVIEARVKAHEQKVHDTQDQIASMQAQGEAVKSQHVANNANEQVGNTFNANDPNSEAATIARLAGKEQARQDTMDEKDRITGVSDQQQIAHDRKEAQLDDALAALKAEAAGQPAAAAAPVQTQGAVANEEGLIAH
jgi:phage shock protein A